MNKPPLIFRRGMTGYEPVNAAARAAWAADKIGDTFRMEKRKPRVGKHSAKYWVLCHAIAEAVGPSVTAELISDTLKMRTGHCNVIQTRRGEVRTPKSIAFDKMDQTEFSAFYERCLAVIRENFLPGAADSDLKQHIEDLVA